MGSLSESVPLVAGSFLWLIFAVIVTVVLVRAYTRTRMSGFVWLLMAVVVWPFFSRILSMAFPFLALRSALAGTSMIMGIGIVSAVESVVGGVLLLIATLKLAEQCRPALTGAQPSYTAAVPYPSAGVYAQPAAPYPPSQPTYPPVQE